MPGLGHDLRVFLQGLPKAELHLHLRGAMPAAVLGRLLEKYPPAGWIGSIPVRHQDIFRSHPGIGRLLSGDPGRDPARHIFAYETFPQFLVSFFFTGYLLREREDLELLVEGVARELVRQNIVHAEITCSVPEYLRQGFSLEEVLSCLEGVRRVDGVRVIWIMDLVRDYGAGAALELLERVGRDGSGVVSAITLGGSEHLFPPALFGRVYERARELGLRRTIHAGEALGPESVRAALDLGVERIGHGVRVLEDPAVVEEVASRGVPLEICPTSNVRTGLYPSLDHHPLPDLLAAGLELSLNTDDPTFFDTTLVDEYLAARALGVAPEALRDLISNGFRQAFLPPEDVLHHLDDLERAWGQGPPG